MDERIKKTQDATRLTRSAEVQPAREAADASLVSSQERRKMFREFSQEALPTPPAIPGWHFIWLSTTNQYDPIYKRERMGYEPVKAEEVPGYTNYRVKSGEFEGLVAVNEMLLFKIPQDIYQEIMEEYHHNMPLEEEEMLKANIEKMADRDSSGKRLGSIEGDGIGSLGQRVKTPVFS
jgi:hypothetical protein